MGQDDRGPALAVVGDQRGVIADCDELELGWAWHSVLLERSRKHRVRVQCARKAGVEGNVLGKREELGRGQSRPQRSGGVRCDLLLCAAERGENRERRKLTLLTAQFAVRQRPGERALDKPAVELRVGRPELPQSLTISDSYSRWPRDHVPAYG
jgi:hypothetical protein